MFLSRFYYKSLVWHGRNLLTQPLLLPHTTHNQIIRLRNIAIWVGRNIIKSHFDLAVETCEMQLQNLGTTMFALLDFRFKRINLKVKMIFTIKKYKIKQVFTCTYLCHQFLQYIILYWPLK